MSDDHSPKVAIEFRDVHFAYQGTQTPALNGISLVFPRGSFTVVMGPSGAGKTTLARCINGIVPKYYRGEFSGDVQISDRSIGTCSVPENAADVGMVFQDFESQIFSTDILLDLAFGPENLGHPPADILDRARNIMHSLHFEGMADRDSTALSGGQKQRLAIASVLMMGTPIIVLDEPTTDLDPRSRIEILELLNAIRRTGRTVILIDHSPEVALSADRVIVLNAGEVVADGEPGVVFAALLSGGMPGIRAPQLMDTLQRLGIPPCPSTVEETEALIRKRYRVESAGHRRESELRPDITEPAIRVENLRFSYSACRVLDGIDLSIGRGDFVALLGRNGSGKTTLAKHLNGILTPDEGQVWIGGMPVNGMSAGDLVRSIGYVFQNPDHQLFCPRIREELEFGLRQGGIDRSEWDRRIEAALGAVGLSGRETADPFMLTKGDRQRVAVASVLVMTPRIIVLDEPTTGLDHRDQLGMMALIERLNREGHTIVMITHSMTVAMQFAKRIVLMAGGRVIGDGDRSLFLRDDLFLEAGLRRPPIADLSARFGWIASSVEEFVAWVREGAGGGDRP